MKISYRWLSELVDLKGLSATDLADKLTSRGLEVELIERQDQGFEQVVSVEILKRDPHPQADRLSLCSVTTGTGDPLEIVCGAQNMRAGDIVALAQIGAHLPNGLKITQSKIRGVVSNGMLCSESELGLAKESQGILLLPVGTPLGKPLAQLLGRDDTILHLKLTANRSDCLSHFGLAREVGAALGSKAKRPEAKLPEALSWKGSPVSVHLEAGDKAPQFFGVAIDGVKIGPSPAWLVKRLEGVGARSINNVVDATNLVMLESGHPVHAYDADRIEGAKIIVRIAREGEELPLLDGSQLKLEGQELVIADGARAVGLAGVMGGGNSEVQDGTTRVFLECAEFSASLVRRASSRHQKKTDASHRFERGIDAHALPLVISRLASLVLELAGGRITGSTAVKTREPSAPKGIAYRPDHIRSFLGMSVDGDVAQGIFTALDCQVVAKSREEWVVTPPSFRLDLVRKEDLAEEIARSVGYDAIPATIPPLTSSPQIENSESSSAWLHLRLIDRAKDLCAQAGLSEPLNYSFTSKQWLKKFGMTSQALIVNPLTEDHEAMVPSLIPGLVRTALDNWNHHFGSEALAMRLFELRPVYSGDGAIQAKGEMETTARERLKLAFAVSGPRFRGGLSNELGQFDFYDLKAVVEGLLSGLGTKGTRIRPFSGSQQYEGLFHPGQTAEILAGKDSAGFFGLLHPALASELKIRAPLWIAELDWEALAQLSPPVVEAKSYQPWPQFPGIERDFALLVKDDVASDKITQVALKAGKPLAKVAKVFDIYRGSQVSEGMTSVAVRVIFLDETRSLQESEAEAASNQILSAWKKELGIELRS